MNSPQTFAEARQRLAERFAPILAGLVRSQVRACEAASNDERECIEKQFQKLLKDARDQYHELLMNLASAYAKKK